MARATSRSARTKKAASAKTPALKKPRGSKHRTIREAAQFGSADDVKAFLDAGWPPDTRDGLLPSLPSELGLTALAMACFHKKPAIVKLLLDAGADPNLRSTSMPLVYAVTSKSKRAIEMVRLLLAAGAHPDPDAYRDKNLIDYISGDPKLADIHALLVAAKAARRVSAQ